MVLLHQCIERALLAVMAELDALHIVRSCALSLSHLHHLVFRHEQEFGLGVDEFADEPGAGYPIHFHSLTRNPFHGKNPFFQWPLALLAFARTSRAAFRPAAKSSDLPLPPKCVK